MESFVLLPIYIRLAKFGPRLSTPSRCNEIGHNYTIKTTLFMIIKVIRKKTHSESVFFFKSSVYREFTRNMLLWSPV